MLKEYVQDKKMKDGCPDMLPSEVHDVVTSLNTYADRLKKMYKLTQKTARDVELKKIRAAQAAQQRIDNPPPPLPELTPPKETHFFESRKTEEEKNYEKEKERRKKQKAKEEDENEAREEILKANKEYTKKMLKLDDNSDFAGEAQNYIGSQDTDMDKLVNLEYSLHREKEYHFISLVIEVNQYIEQAKQIREYKRANSGTADNADVAGATKDDHIYTYGSNNSFISENNLDNVLDDLRGKKDKKTISDDEEKKLSHLEHIKAESDLEAAFKEKKVPQTLNDAMVRAYLDFSPESYDAAIKAAKKQDLEKISNTRAAASQGKMREMLTVKKEKEQENSQTLPIIVELGKACEDFNTYALPLVKPLSEAMKSNDDLTGNPVDKISSDLKGNQEEIIEKKKPVVGVKKYINLILDGILHAIPFVNIYLGEKEKMEAIRKGDLSEYVQKQIESVLNSIRAVITVASSIVSGAKSVAEMIKKVYSVGEKAVKLFTSIGHGFNIASGVIDTIGGIADSIIHGLAASRATKAGKKIKEIDAANSKQFSRFMHQYNLAEKERMTEGIVDSVKGAASTAWAIASIALAPSAIVSGIVSVGCIAASIAAKQIIKKIFKGKQTEEAFRDLIGAGKYDDIMKRMSGRWTSGRSDERFHNVLRRTTGIATRTDYRQALNVTDAIDLYTAARVYRAVNPLGEPQNKEQQVIKAAMGGLGYNISGYDQVSLEDILGKVGEDSDWKGILRTALTNNHKMIEKEDVKADDVKKSDTAKAAKAAPKAAPPAPPLAKQKPKNRKRANTI